jgi:hypothetical protein
VELEITPEPSEEERAAILAALEEQEPDAAPHWLDEDASP